MALADHDDEIAELIHNTIVGESIEGGGIQLGDLITSKANISLSRILKDVSVGIRRRLETRWHIMCREILRYKASGRNINSLSKEDEDFVELYYWISNIRRRWKKHDLPSFQIDLLMRYGLKRTPDGQLNILTILKT